jgi:hypothetical protein
MIQNHPDTKNIEALIGKDMIYIVPYLIYIVPLKTLHSFLNHNKGIVYRHSLAYRSSVQAALGNSLYK